MGAPCEDDAANPNAQPIAITGEDVRTEQQDRVRQLIARLLLRLEQSRDGLSRAAGRSTDPGRGLWFIENAHRRDHLADGMRTASHELRLTVPRKHDIAGPIHRLFIALLGEAGDAALVDECVRGDERLVRTIRKTLDGPLPDRLRSEVERAYTEVTAFIEEARAARKALDSGFVDPGEIVEAIPKELTTTGRATT